MIIIISSGILLFFHEMRDGSMVDGEGNEEKEMKHELLSLGASHDIFIMRCILTLY